MSTRPPETYLRLPSICQPRLFHVDLVAAICGGYEFGETNLLSRLIYSLVGAAGGYAVYQVFSLKRVENRWNIGQRDGTSAAA